MRIVRANRIANTRLALLLLLLVVVVVLWIKFQLSLNVFVRSLSFFLFINIVSRFFICLDEQKSFVERSKRMSAEGAAARVLKAVYNGR